MANLEIILQELRDFRRENSETLKEIKDNIKSESNRIDDAKQWIVKAEERLQHVEEATQELLALQKLFDDRLLDLEGHLRGKNIRIHGVKEGAEDCAKSMIEFVDALLRIQLELPISLHFLIEKAHRAPASRPPQDSTRRAIVVRFKSFRMKYEILKRAWQKKGFEYEGSRVFLDHDYAPEALTKRQEYAEAENVLTERNICFQTPFPARSRAFDEGEIRIANSAEEATTGMARRGLQVTMLKPKESGLEKTKCLTLQDPPKASTPPCVPLTFSSPIVKPTAAGPPSFSPSAGFTFGTPVAKLGPTPTTAAGASVEAASSASSAPVFGLGDKFKKPEGAWDCDVCLVQNKAADVQCVVCEAAKPGASMEPKAFSGVFKASADWTCDVCLTPNKLSDTKCVCCAAPQPNSSPKSIDSKQTPAPSVGLESSSKNTSTTTTSTAAAEAATGFGSVFSKPTGTWDCDTCLVLNKPDAVKCVACETAKPGTGLKPSLTLPSAFSAVKTVSTPAEPAATGFTGFGDKFKKPEGSWECDTCMVQNKAEDTKCVACTSAKPGASAEAASSASSAPVFGLGDKFKKPEGAWDCDVCQAQNKAADVQCVACQAAKPGASVEPKAFGSSAGGTTLVLSTPTYGGFKFGTSDKQTSSSLSAAGGLKFGGSLSESTASSGGFKFGVPFGSAPSETTPKDSTASSGFKFGSSDGFKFGTASSEDKSEQPAAGSGLKFYTSHGIVFRPGSSSTESNSSKGGFTFGLSKPNPTTTTTATTTGSVLGDPSLATNASQGRPAFGSLQANKEPATPKFTFGKPDNKKDVAGSSLLSNYKRQRGAASTRGFSFNKSSAPAKQPSLAFTFGKPADKSEAVTSEAPKPTFTFRQNAAASGGFQFGGSSGFGATNNTSSVFTFGAGATGSPAPATNPSMAPQPGSGFIFNQTPVNIGSNKPLTASPAGQKAIPRHKIWKGEDGPGRRTGPSFYTLRSVNE
ncbi:nuclear pore complex protein Nup153-like [Salarias fasciatus]|uniref:nuclear pore complex protein Nup153-like n=1 Tax=Salarias fasciatus TaxID=181472 RepID=UPI001176F0B6|nr:nuclear pore complex protein Nup153-like [Salarias fasciatus]